MLCYAAQEAKNDPAATTLLLIRLQGVWRSFWETRHMIRAYSRAEHCHVAGKTGKYEELTTALLDEYCILYMHR